jgi:uncharacterized membrane protein
MNSLSALQNRNTEPGNFPTALARGLGWFSIALGTAKLVAPKLVAGAIGIESSPVTSVITRLVGAREIASGLNMLLQPRRPLPLWARVAGDAVDLALLGVAGLTQRADGLRLAGAVAAVGAVTALDLAASVKTQRAFDAANRPVMFSVTIAKPASEVYAAFRDFKRLPEFMDYLEEVRETSSTHSTWRAKTPLGGKTVSWDAHITEDTPGEVIAWESVDGSAIKTSGRVTFAKTAGRDMTEVRVEMKLGFTGIGASSTLAKYFVKPQLKGDLRRFKQVVETGEVLLSDATVTRKPHPAQPSTPEVIESNARHAVPVFQPNPTTAKKGQLGPDAQKGTIR